MLFSKVSQLTRISSGTFTPLYVCGSCFLKQLLHSDQQIPYSFADGGVFHTYNNYIFNLQLSYEFKNNVNNPHQENIMKISLTIFNDKISMLMN